MEPCTISFIVKNFKSNFLKDGCESREQSQHEEFVFDSEFHVPDDSSTYNFDILNQYKNYTKAIAAAAHKNCLDSNFLYGFASKIFESVNVTEPDFNQLTEELVDTINAINATSGTINERMEAALQKDRNSLNLLEHSYMYCSNRC